MATLPESATWTAGIYQLERSNLWDAGTGGNGVGNQREKELANRTLYLKTEIEKRWNREHSQVTFSSLSVADSTIKFAKDVAYALAFPLGEFDYTTPNDGLTRDYIISAGCHVGPNFAYSGTATVQIAVITSTAGPTYVELASAATYQPGTQLFCQKKVTLGPNVRVATIINVGAVGASVTISGAFLRIEEVIK